MVPSVVYREAYAVPQKARLWKADSRRLVNLCVPTTDQWSRVFTATLGCRTHASSIRWKQRSPISRGCNTSAHLVGTSWQSTAEFHTDVIRTGVLMCRKTNYENCSCESDNWLSVNWCCKLKRVVYRRPSGHGGWRPIRESINVMKVKVSTTASPSRTSRLYCESLPNQERC